MGKDESVLKKLKALLPKKSASTGQAKEPDFVTPAKARGPKEISNITPEQLKEITDSDFSNSEKLADSIVKGVKIASHSQNQSWLLSEFKRDVTSWLRAYKKLKIKDFEDKSKNWQTLMKNIIKDARNYKKTVEKDDEDNEIIIRKKNKPDAVKARTLPSIIKKLKGLSINQLDFLNNYKLPPRSKIQELLSQFKILSTLKEQELRGANIFLLRSGLPMSLSVSVGLYETLLTLTDEELAVAAELCYHSTDHWYTMLYEDDEGDIYFGKAYRFNGPMERLNKTLLWLEAIDDWNKHTKGKKFDFNKSKVNYMEAMSSSASKALESLPKSTKK